jgi:hypothetical protein
MGTSKKKGGAPTPDEKSTAMVKAGAGSALPAKGIDFAADAGMGFENTDADSFAVPFLSILQKMSPQCDPDSGAYIKGAKPGDFFNSVTGEVYGDTVQVVPAHFVRLFVEWVPRDQGGGFRGSHKPDDDIVRKATRNDRGKFLLSNGNELMDTRYHFALMIRDGGAFVPVLIAFTSTQIKKSRAWLSIADGIKFRSKDNRLFTPPLFSHVYRLSTVTESNDLGTWKGYKVEIDHPIGDGELDLYLAAKDFRERVKAGSATIPNEPPPDAGSRNDNDDIPEM